MKTTKQIALSAALIILSPLLVILLIIGSLYFSTELKEMDREY